MTHDTNERTSVDTKIDNYTVLFYKVITFPKMYRFFMEQYVKINLLLLVHWLEVDMKKSNTGRLEIKNETLKTISLTNSS